MRLCRHEGWVVVRTLYKSDEFLLVGGREGSRGVGPVGSTSVIGSRCALAISVHRTYFDLANPTQYSIPKDLMFYLC